MSKKSIFMMLAVFVACIAAVFFLPKTVQAAEVTENGETVFEGWIKRNSPNNIVSDLTKDDFNLNEELNGQTYTNCCHLYAGFSNQELTETEKY